MATSLSPPSRRTSGSSVPDPAEATPAWVMTGMTKTQTLGLDHLGCSVSMGLVEIDIRQHTVYQLKMPLNFLDKVPDIVTAFRILERQRHVYSVWLGPHNQGF